MLHAAGPETPSEPRELSVSAAPSSSQPVIVVVKGGRQTVLWLLAVIGAVLVTAYVSRSDRSMLPAAWAQNVGGLPTGVGARGIYAFTGQLSPKSYGLFMLDVDTGTVWCYELQHGANGEPQMKLVAARSWIYDRYLEEFNVGDPVPSAVKVLIDQQRKAGGGAGAAGVANPQPGGAAAPGPVLPAPEKRQ